METFIEDRYPPRWLRRPQATPALDVFARRMAAFEPQVRAADFAVLDPEVQEVDGDRPIWHEDDRGEHFFAVDSGLAYSFSILPDGRRYISDFFGPGAICNWSRPRRPSFPANILIKGRSRLLAIRKSRLAKLLEQQPQLSNAIARHEHARTLRTAQRARTLVVGQSTDRLMHFLLDVADELSASGVTSEAIPVRLTQREIADVVGLSPVHLNRTIQSLLNEQRITRRNKTYQICNIEEEKRILDYQCCTSLVTGAPGSPPLRAD